MNAEDLFYLEVYDPALSAVEGMRIHSANPNFNALLKFAQGQDFSLWKIYRYENEEFIPVAQGWRETTIDEDMQAADRYTNFGADDPAESDE